MKQIALKSVEFLTREFASKWELNVKFNSRHELTLSKGLPLNTCYTMYILCNPTYIILCM